MPIYEYRCQSCEHELEKLQRMSDGNLVDCPECEKPTLKRLVSAAGFRLKGSGWYETDFKKGDKRNLVDSGKSSSADKSSSATGSSKSGESTGGTKTAKPASKPSAGKTAGA